ncbi:MAG TPA: alpha-L-arabinofuranosidase C-terminal domain-containing protein [Acidobacteriota bacterium]|nr:alpha-L-arabinofuranosidase C-terminal domain-containing protein [Acidobacteriota bacterium]
MVRTRFFSILLSLLLVVCSIFSLAIPQDLSVQVDATQTREPISKYVYGQFIEHLGRCIYGGLWAEMLEDRKFFYPITGETPAWTLFQPGESSWQGEGHPYELLTRSPWMIIGVKGNVTMVTEEPYVGEHTPQVQLVGDGSRRGIMQERLGLVAGKQYVGRVVLAGQDAAAPVEISLVWGSGSSDRETVVVSEVTSFYQKYELGFTAHQSTDNGRIEIVSKGDGRFLVGTVSLMPADNILGWRRDTLALVKELNSPVYRWPGGNFVSGYDWKDGIGDPDRRPPRKNPAWTGIESNDVGIHEYMDLCREIGTEPFIAVNTGLGDVAGSAEEVEYANGAVNTPMGRLRAENGHPEPFGVKWWAVGNEMYGEWQLGHMPLEQYVLKHNRVVEAMRRVDPSIRPIAVGSVGEWSEQMLTSCSDHMELLSEHLYWQDLDDLLEHVGQIREGVERVAKAHLDYRKELESLKGKDIRIALDEWNYWYGANEYGELGVRYFLQDALGIAVGLHEMFRYSELFFMANYAQTVNVIGAIKTTKTQAELEPTGLVLRLYRSRFGSVPVSVQGNYEPLDVVAAWTEDRTGITLGVVNPTEEKQAFELQVSGAKITGKGSKWTITGANRWAYNSPGNPRGVDETAVSFRGVPERVAIAPLSVTLFRFEVR